MKIGKFVQSFVPDIFNYCKKDNAELSRLMDKSYSKEQFDINYPFCTDVSLISSSKPAHYWRDEYQQESGITVRVCNDWYKRNKEPFEAYLLKHQLTTRANLNTKDNTVEPSRENANVVRIRQGRYRGKAIGDAQNALVRNILSNLGNETFNEDDWTETKKYFLNRCAYCGGDEKLFMEHVIPINRTSLGEHRLGNLVPSCEHCNNQKGNKTFREFLGDKIDKVSKIEKYMESRGYQPLEKDNVHIERLLNMARQDMLDVANRYTTILNEMFINPHQR